MRKAPHVRLSCSLRLIRRKKTEAERREFKEGVINRVLTIKVLSMQDLLFIEYKRQCFIHNTFQVAKGHMHIVSKSVLEE